jgi:hypothetical protein
MRLLTLFILLLAFHPGAFSQQIKYSIPAGFEKEISKTDYKKIVDLSIPFITKRYTIDSASDGGVHVSAGETRQTFYLDNLLYKCIGADKSQWKDVVKQHFESLFTSMDEKEKIDLGNFEIAKKYLSIRIYSKQSVDERGGLDKIIIKTDLEGTYTMLMLDLPEAFTSVDKGLFDSWKKDVTEVFKAAQANINSQEIEKVTQNFNTDGGAIEISLLGNENYAASYALDLGNNSPGMVGEWGSVVCMPNKGLVNICKISKSKPVDFVKFIQLTKPLTRKSYEQHPQPISDQYFWYYKGTFTRISVLTDDKGNIQVISPIGLGELMTTK